MLLLFERDANPQMHTWLYKDLSQSKYGIMEST